MLKSTYTAPPPLPPGWTEHKAPSGHLYYYNSETKQSTYKRPAAAPAPAPPSEQVDSTYTPENLPPFSSTPYGPAANNIPGARAHENWNQQFRGGFRGGRDTRDRRHRQPEDRPKTKHVIPGCSPWVLVMTKLGRRFVHNPETNESYWKFPENVLKGVVEFDRLQRENKEKETQEGRDETKPEPVVTQEKRDTPQAQNLAEDAEEESDEYEEVEVTDDEGEEEEHSSKRPRTGSESDGENKLLEFDEDDIEYQLRAMGEEYGLDPGEYGEPDEEGWEEGAEGMELTDEEAASLFRDLLDDFRLNPFTTWEKVIEEGRIIEDTRYTVLPTMKSRREVFSAWSRDRIQEAKARKEKEEKKDPRIKYLAFLHEHATPKLYWPEFKRKYRKEEVMKSTQMSDKDREKFYRDHIARLKLSESTKKSDLSTLLKSIPPQQLNNASNIESLPSTILTDIRYISLPSKIRDPLLETYISTLPSPPDEDLAALSAEEQEERQRKKLERERREKALAERERRVEEEKRRRKGDLLRGKSMLRQEAAEIEDALQIRGKEGLRKYIDEEGVHEKDS